MVHFEDNLFIDRVGLQGNVRLLRLNFTPKTLPGAYATYAQEDVLIDIVVSAASWAAVVTPETVKGMTAQHLVALLAPHSIKQ